MKRFAFSVALLAGIVFGVATFENHAAADAGVVANATGRIAGESKRAEREAKRAAKKKARANHKDDDAKYAKAKTSKGSGSKSEHKVPASDDPLEGL